MDGGKHPSTREIVEMILSGGLLEDLLSYLREKGVDVEGLKSIYDLDPQVVREYAVAKNIIEDGDRVDELKAGGDVEERYEPLELRPRTQPR